MPLKSRLFGTGAATLAIAMAASGCSSSGSGGGTDDAKGTNGKTSVTIALPADPSSLDPQKVQDGNALAVYDNIAETLIVRDSANSKLHPGLALSWKNVDDTTWQFKLRKNVKFSDGEPFNAATVVYSIKRIIDPSFGTEQSWVGPINGAKVVDDNTVDITTKAADPALAARLSEIFMVPPKAADSPDFANKPIGTGPYTMVSWAKGSQVVLKANPEYWGGEPSIKKVTFQPIQEPTVQMASLQTGKVDLVPGLLPENRSKAPSVLEARGPEFPGVILNTRSGPFKNPLVRQAANYAVDKETLLKSLYDGLGAVGQCQFMGKDVFGFNPALKPYAYDPEKAKKLLSEAGDLHPSVDLIGDSSNRWLKDVEMEQSIASYLEKVGFKVNLKLSDFPSYLKELFPKDNNKSVARPDMIYFSRSNDIPDPSDTFSGWYTTTGVGSSTSDTNLDKLVARGESELNDSKREAIYQEVNKAGCDSANFIFLLNLDNLYGTAKGLTWTPRIDGQLLVKTMHWSTS